MENNQLILTKTETSGQEQLILQSLSDPDTGQVFVIDTYGDYTNLADQSDTEVLHLRPGGNVFINPLEMRASCDPMDDSLSWRADIMHAFFEQILGDNALTPRMRAVIDFLVKALRSNHSARLPDLLTELRRIDAAEGKLLADAIEVFAIGTVDCFSQRSNTRRKSRLVVYNISAMPTHLHGLSLSLCLCDIWDQVVQAWDTHIHTHAFISYLDFFLQNDASAELLCSIWKRARMHGCVLTGMVSDQGTLLCTPYGRNILNNAECKTALE